MSCVYLLSTIFLPEFIVSYINCKISFVSSIPMLSVLEITTYLNMDSSSSTLVQDDDEDDQIVWKLPQEESDHTQLHRESQVSLQVSFIDDLNHF